MGGINDGRIRRIFAKLFRLLFRVVVATELLSSNEDVVMCVYSIYALQFIQP